MSALPDMEAAWIALSGVVVSAAISASLAWFTALRTTRSERAKRQGELALSISNLISVTDEESRGAAFRRFAVGIVKVVEPEDHQAAGEVYFIPMFSRVTVGRHDMNDICLDGDQAATSRWHCGFVADRDTIWIDDYLSTNGTFVNGQRISQPTKLQNGDKIRLALFGLEFRSIRENTILLQ